MVNPDFWLIALWCACAIYLLGCIVKWFIMYRIWKKGGGKK